METQIVLKYRKDIKDVIAFEKPSKQFESKLSQILKNCENYDDFVLLKISPPYKPRTTGEGSQNNLVWKLITIIAEHTGSDIADVEQGLKDKAINKGYPYHINPVTHKPSGDSMKGINTVECSYLIDTAYEIIAEYGIILPPTLTKEHKKETPITLDKSFNNLRVASEKIDTENCSRRGADQNTDLAEQALSEEEFDIF